MSQLPAFPDPDLLTLIGLCGTCGCVTQRTTVLAVEGDDEFAAHQCGACFDRCMVELAALDRQFKMLVENGVSPARANEIIIARIDEAERSGRRVLL